LVSGKKIVCWDRRREIILDEAGVVKKFGVRPHSIPDWLALVGDAADGYPGIPGWGAKSASAVLSRYEHIEEIPGDPGKWKVNSISAGRAVSLAENLSTRWDEALLYRQLSTLREDVPLKEKISDLKWRGAWEKLKEICHKLGDENIPKRISRWRSS
jgi:5'-3' exonuclease